MKTAKTGFVDQTSRLRKEKMHDIWFCGTAFPFCGGITLCGGNTSDMERAVILCDRLSPKGNGAGGNWICSFGGRTCLWKNCSVCRCAGNHYHGTAWGNRDGCSLSKVAGKGKLKKIFRKYFGRKCVIVIAEKRK